ncbi:putative BMP-2-inducible kinase-like protein [Saguinus oedipus]|uniref:BMP-2-inducible kinase-like protein n=1 Tax=Saguinus oedipus TaxID=9490 RepID=A0ABQ9TFA5_SAGOE|nr:putative BMP-2-inducible kinase-like protein [Saguinus oedipus]
MIAPSPKSSEEKEEEDEVLWGEQGDFNDDDTEPENVGYRPLLMDSEDEEEEKHSSDSDYEQAKAKYSDMSPVYRDKSGSGPTQDLNTILLTSAQLSSDVGVETPKQEFDLFGTNPFFVVRAQQPQQEKNEKNLPQHNFPAAGLEQEDIEVRRVLARRGMYKNAMPWGLSTYSPWLSQKRRCIWLHSISALPHINK